MSQRRNRLGSWWWLGALIGTTIACGSGAKAPKTAAEPAPNLGGSKPLAPAAGSDAGAKPSDLPVGDAAAPSPGPITGPSADAGADVDLQPSGDGAPASDLALPPGAGKDTVVVEAFKAAHIYFLNVNDKVDNRRSAYVTSEFPPAGGVGRAVTLRIRLGCPSGRCDGYDRWGLIGIPHGEGDAETITEIARFVTPYGREAEWTIDVTELAPLLAGSVKLIAKIDTWVGPGHQLGDGWLFDASFVFSPAQANTRVPKAVIPLWDIESFEVGDPAKPSAPTVASKSVPIPAGATAITLRSIITGHGQGNHENCAEFCPKNHGYQVSGKPFQTRIWRDDCATTAVRPQPRGAAPFAPRAGWCPGAMVRPWTVDVTAAHKPGSPATVAYQLEPFVNTCRPTAPVCSGCVFKTSCAYDNGLHTAPSYLHSALLIVY